MGEKKGATAIDNAGYIGENSFYINGAITIPQDRDWEEFMGELLKWLEGRDAYFFGSGGRIEDRGEAMEKIMAELGNYEEAAEEE